MLREVELVANNGLLYIAIENQEGGDRIFLQCWKQDKDCSSKCTAWEISKKTDRIVCICKAIPNNQKQEIAKIKNRSKNNVDSIVSSISKEFGV